MQKILIVCLGNICRSPLAEGILIHMVNERKLDLHIDSAGTSSHHEGESPDPRTVRNAKKHNIDLSRLRARPFARDDFDQFDKIFVMDKSNLQNVLRLAKTDEHRQKVDLFLNISNPGKNLEVPDPWYGGDEGFEEVFQMIYRTCDEFLRAIEKNGY